MKDSILNEGSSHRIKPSARNKIVLVICAVLAFALIIIAYHYLSNNHKLALADKKVSESALQLCSPYANICFTRPNSWTRSSILHVDGSKENTIEINPPTGTILVFAKTSHNTNNRCDTSAYKECLIQVARITALNNGQSVVSGILTSSPDANCRETCTRATFMPFVQLISHDDIQKYHLDSASLSFKNFNASAQLGNGGDVYFQITPGKGYDAESAQDWLDSPEAKTAQKIIASATQYK